MSFTLPGSIHGSFLLWNYRIIHNIRKYTVYIFQHSSLSFIDDDRITDTVCSKEWVDETYMRQCLNDLNRLLQLAKRVPMFAGCHLILYIFLKFFFVFNFSPFFFTRIHKMVPTNISILIYVSRHISLRLQVYQTCSCNGF